MVREDTTHSGNATSSHSLIMLPWQHSSQRLINYLVGDSITSTPDSFMTAVKYYMTVAQW